MVSRLVKKYLLLGLAILVIGYFTFFRSSGITSGSLRSCLNATNQASILTKFRIETIITFVLCCNIIVLHQLQEYTLSLTVSMKQKHDKYFYQSGVA